MLPNWSKRMQEGILFRPSVSSFSITGSNAEGLGHVLMSVSFDTEQCVVPKSMVTMEFGVERKESVERLVTRVALEEPFWLFTLSAIL